MAMATLLLAMALLACPALAARQVFVLNSYHPGYKWSDDLMHGLEATLHQFDPETLIHTEYMDTKRNLDPAYLQSLPAFMKLKYDRLRPDLVVAADESAFFFMLEHGPHVFPETPTVFCGVNTSPLPPLPPWMTGVHERSDLGSTIELMRRVQPGMRELVIIADRTATGLAIEAELRKAVPPNLPVRILEDLPVPELARQVARLGPESGLLFLVYFRDRDGNIYGPTEAIASISEASPVPVFGSWNFLMGHGLFGGYLTNGYEQGRLAGDMAGRIMAGAKPADIPVAFDGGVSLEVDARQMERFGITSAQFPEETRFFNANLRSGREILILHSYHQGFKWTDDILAGIMENLGQDGARAEVHVEYMDSKRYPEPEFTYLNYLLLREKYRFTKFSLVLTSDDNAFNFARQYRQALFRDAPVVFCGVNYLAEPSSLAAGDITGVLESYNIVATVAAARSMVPAARKLYVINDDTPTGIGNHKRFEEVRHLLPEGLQVEFMESMSMARLLERLPELPHDAVVLLMSFNRDRDGNVFSYEESCKQISHASPVPVFSFWDFYLGSGSVGGMVTSGYHQGLAAGELARKVLAGSRAGDLPVITQSPNTYIFDARVMERFGIDRRHLPADATLINDDREATRYVRAMWTIAGLILLIAVLLSAFGLVYRWQHRKRKALEQTVRIDPLTGACTRGAFEAEMPHRVLEAGEKKEKFMLCYVDVNKLKQVNDTFGHLHGDTYLKEVVAILRACIRASDVIYRIGGDEFVLVFPGCGQSEVRRVWDLVRRRIGEANDTARLPYAMGLTHGCVEFDPNAPQDLAALLRQADRTMYTRKTHGPSAN